MLIFDETQRTIILSDIHTPLTSDYIYVLDLEMKDFKLVPLLVLEEIVAPAAELLIDGFKFTVPTLWSILIGDDETSIIDIIPVKDLLGKNFKAFVYGHKSMRPVLKDIEITNFFNIHTVVAPSLNRQQMLCHPISANTWINISPSDSYAKNLKEVLIGDFF